MPRQYRVFAQRQSAGSAGEIVRANAVGSYCDDMRFWVCRF
jgi:hypothetical protein